MRILAVCYAHDPIPLGSAVVIELYEPEMRLRVRLVRDGDLDAWFKASGGEQLNTALPSGTPAAGRKPPVVAAARTYPSPPVTGKRRSA